MHISIRSQIKAYFLCLIFGGCASFEPGLGYQNLSRPREPTVKEVQEALEVSVEEFASTNKSRQAFDADIAPHRVLALLLKVENNGDKTYRIMPLEIAAYLHDQPLTALTSKQASQAATSEYAGKAILWAIAPGPLNLFFGIPGAAAAGASAAHTRAVNRRIEQHFETLQFVNAVLKPNQVATGFVYFKLPDNIKNLEELSVEVVASEEKSDNRLSYRLSLPTLNLSAPTIPPAAGEGSEGKEASTPSRNESKRSQD